MIILRLCGGPSNFTNPPSTDEKNAVVYDSDIAILDGTNCWSGSGNIRGENEVTVGIMCPRYKILMLNSVTGYLDMRIASNNNLRLGASSSSISPLKIVPIGKS